MQLKIPRLPWKTCSILPPMPRVDPSCCTSWCLIVSHHSNVLGYHVEEYVCCQTFITKTMPCTLMLKIKTPAYSKPFSSPCYELSRYIYATTWSILDVIALPEHTRVREFYYSMSDVCTIVVQIQLRHRIVYMGAEGIEMT